MLIALEGIDGSGKGTQARLLFERCEKEGLRAAKTAFPQYGRTPFAEAISEYLNGTFGGTGEVHPKLVSVLYAADRFAVKDQLVSMMESSQVVICDRYTASNMAHQAAKLPLDERSAFLDWLARIEYGAFGLPQADLTILLDMPAEIASLLVSKKGSRAPRESLAEGEQGGYTTLEADIHEADLDYLSACREVYLDLAERGVGGRWARVECAAGGSARPVKEIADEVWGLL